MGRRARRGVIVGLLVCLPVATLVTFPTVAKQLGDSLSSRDAVRVAHGPQLHRGKKVRITGAAQGQLSPGTSAPVSLKFQNPNAHKVRINRVRVKIASVAAPYADAARPCSTTDFRIRQMPKRMLRLPARKSTDLAKLGVPVAAWPQLAMLNRPVNQDGCKGATLTLRFKARGLKR